MAEHDPIREALDQLIAHGLDLDAQSFQVEQEGESAHGSKPHYCPASGHRSGEFKKNKGWYRAVLVTLRSGAKVVIGAYGNYYLDGDGHHKFRIKADLSDDDRERLKERTEQLRKDFEANRAELAQLARQRAEKMWPRLPDVGRCDYLQRKGVGSFGIRFAKGGSLVVPVRTIEGVLVGLQFIQADGAKLFLTGTAKTGAFHLIGAGLEHLDHLDTVVFAEGYATAATVHAATGYPAVVCFDAGNLLAVMRVWRRRLPNVACIVAADNDHETKGNPGVSKARRAAREIGARVAVPQFALPAGQTDFNDLYLAEGIEAVTSQLDAADYVDDAQEAGSAPAGSGAGDGMPPPKNREQTGGAAPDDDDGQWQEQLVFGREGLKAMVHNARVVMWHHVAWQGVLGFDEFQQRVVMLKPPPWGSKPGPVSDVDEIEAAAFFGRSDTYGCSLSTGIAREAMLAVARQRSFHPVRDYLRACASGWDGVDRLPTFFSDFCGVEANEVHAAFAINFFLSAVARIFRPGVKADLMLVLEGEQGLRKSTLFNVLCGDAWFLDLGAAPSDKDFYQLIQGRWLVEISELASFAKSDTSHIKRAITARHDVFRPAYGRNPVECPRQCVFVGTVNNSTWQRDETGGRRYMPIWIKEINLEAIRHLRDLLWGEACVRFERGEGWWVLPAAAVEVQADRYEDDVWSALVWRWLEGKAHENRYSKGKGLVTKTSISEVLEKALDVEPKKQDKASQMRVGTIMLRLGWLKRQKRVNGLRLSVYFRPEQSGDGEAQP